MRDNDLDPELRADIRRACRRQLEIRSHVRTIGNLFLFFLCLSVGATVVMLFIQPLSVDLIAGLFLISCFFFFSMFGYHYARTGRLA
jgi:hypothetical protein